MSVCAYREALHKIPELGYQEFQTKAYLLDQLQKLDCQVHEVLATGLVAYFDNQQAKTLAFRTDIDALPIQEATQHDFPSEHAGMMHACGHDGHMAMMLAFADYLQEHREELTANVVLIFQPAEESGCGAQTIIDSGLLEKYQVEAVFGFHVWPQLAAGKIFTRAGGLLSQCQEIDIVVKGRSTHIADSELGIDSVQVATMLLGDIYRLEQTAFKDKPHLLKFGEISGGTIRNIIAKETVIKGSMRSFDPAVQAFMREQLAQLAQKYAVETGAVIELNYSTGYPAVVNDPDLVEKVKNSLPEVQELAAPFYQGEDFGVYTEHYPCVFFLLGLGDVPPLHNEHFDFASQLLNNGVKAYQQLLMI